MKTICFGHSKLFDYEEELYKPVRESELNREYNIIFPHENGNKFYNSKELFQSGKCDYFIAEVSFPTTSLGIEMGWADLLNIPIICVYKKGSKVSKSLGAVTDKFIEYSDKQDLLTKLEECFSGSRLRGRDDNIKLFSVDRFFFRN